MGEQALGSTAARYQYVLNDFRTVRYAPYNEYTMTQQSTAALSSSCSQLFANSPTSQVLPLLEPALCIRLLVLPKVLWRREAQKRPVYLDIAPRNKSVDVRYSNQAG